MNIGLSTPTMNIYGAILLRCMADSDIGGVSRRISRTATLDGKSVLTDFGESSSDITMRIKVILTRELDSRIRDIIKSYPIITVSTRLGCYVGGVESYSVDNGIGNLTYLVQSKVSE